MKATPLLLPVDIFSIYTLQLVHNDPFFTPIRRPLPQTRFLKLGWRPEAISKEIFNPVRTIRYWESNLLRYGSSLPPRNRTFGRPCKLTRADEDALFNILA